MSQKQLLRCKMGRGGRVHMTDTVRVRARVSEGPNLCGKCPSGLRNSGTGSVQGEELRRTVNTSSS